MSWYMIYALILVDNIISLLQISLILSLCWIFMFFLISLVNFEGDFKETIDNFKKFKGPLIIILIGISATVLTILPNKKEIAAIYIIPKIYNTISTNEAIKKLPNNLLDLANDWLKELSPNNKREDNK